MLVPAVRVANLFLSASKGAHNFAVDASVDATGWLAMHDTPSPVHDALTTVITTALLWGDAFGSFMLHLYVLLINL